MGVWAKLDGLRKQAEGKELTLNFEEIRIVLQKPKTAKELSILGLSKGGIAEISQGAPISEPKDRKIVSAILAIVAGAMIDKNFG